MSLSLASVSLAFTTATTNISAVVFNSLNSDLETAILTGNFVQVRSTFETLNRLSPNSLKEYMEQGSFRSALPQIMRANQFQKLYDALTMIEKEFPKFMNLECRLCRAACMLQLSRAQECAIYLEHSNNPKVLNLINDAVQNAHSHEKTAYEELQLFCVQPL